MKLITKFVLLLGISLFLVYESIVTLNDVTTNSVQYGNLYTKYLYNSVLQLIFAIAIPICLSIIYVSLSVESIKEKVNLFRFGLIMSSILLITYIAGYYYIRYNQIEAWNAIFIGLLISTAFPIATFITQLLVISQKSRN